MHSEMAVIISKQLLWETFVLACPVVGTALVVGLIISIFQVATQIQDATISFVPKMLAVVVMLFFLSSWMLMRLTNFMTTLFLSVADVL